MNRSGLACHLLVPDSHIPFEDKRAFELLLKVANWLKPDEIDLMGDFADFYEVSFHDKDPQRGPLGAGRHTRFQQEVNAVKRRLTQLESLSDKLVYVMGNHENRLQRYLAQKAPELAGIVSVEQLLELEPWKVIPYGDHHQIGKLYLTHDVGYSGANAHRQSRSQYEGNVCIGHNHRLAVEYAGNTKGSAHVGASLGWLGDKSAIDYMHRAKSAAWMLGFGLAYVERKTGNAHVVPVPIIDYRCVVEGKLFTR